MDAYRAITIAFLLLVLPARADEPVDEEGLIVVEVPGTISRDAVVRIDGDSLYLPYLWLCALLQISGRASSSGDTLSGSFPSDSPFLIVADERRLVARDSSIELTGTPVIVRDGEAYVAMAALQRALGIPFLFMPADLRLRIHADARLPVVDAAERARRYASLEFYRAELERAGSRTASFSAERPLFGSAVVEWSANAAYLGSPRYGSTTGSAVTRIAAPLLGGVVDATAFASYVSMPVPQSSVKLVGAGWRLPIEDFAPLRSIALQTAQYGPLQRYSISLSNVSALHSLLFDMATIRGSTRPGWTVELERDGQLLDIVHADSTGTYSFHAPIHYGSSSYLIRELGEYGEVETHRESFYVSPSFFPPGHLEYTATASFDRSPGASILRGTTEVNVGLTSWLSVAAGADYLSREYNRFEFDSLRPVGRLLVRTDMGLELAGGYDALQEAFTASTALQLRGDFRAQVNAQAIAPWRSEYRADGAMQTSFAGISLSLLGQYRQDSLGRRADLTPQVSVQSGVFSINASTRLSIGAGMLDTVATLRPIHSTLQVSTALLSRLFVFGRAQYDHDAARIGRAELTGVLPLGRWLRLGLSGGVEYVDGYQGYASAEATLDLSQLRFTATSNVRPELVETRTRLEGVVGVSEGGLRVSREGGNNESALALRAYHDRDLDGEWDIDEEQLAAPTASLTLNGSSAGTVRGEHFGLVPEVTYWGQIDAWSLASEGLYPRWRNFSAYLLPSTFHTVDIPFAEGLDAFGRVGIHDPLNPQVATAQNMPVLNGLRMRLRQVDGCGDYEAVLFSDGGVTFEGVAPGRYRVLFDEAQLRLRFLQAPPPFEVEVSQEHPELPRIVLEQLEIRVPGSGLHH